MKSFYLLFIIFFYNVSVHGQSDSIANKNWIRTKISFGRSQHIQYPGNNKAYKTNTLFNKSYYTFLSLIQYKGFKPFISFNYEYFITKSVCYTCHQNELNFLSKKQLHFINFASLGLGFTNTVKFKIKSDKVYEIIFGASIERYLFKRAFIYIENTTIEKASPFFSNDLFFNHYFFKDLYGIRVYNVKDYKVFMQVSGVLVRNERLNYQPSRYTFHNFMLGFNVFLK